MQAQHALADAQPTMTSSVQRCTVPTLAQENPLAVNVEHPKLIRPQGAIVTIDDANVPMPMAGMKTKAASLHWEFMFGRAMRQTPDMIEQSNLLTWVAAQVDAGKLKTTASEMLSPINAANLCAVHRRIETGQVKGKIVLSGFDKGAQHNRFTI